jgi:hypothetical protein
VNFLSDNGMAQLVVKNRRDPPTRRRLEKFSGYDYSTLPDVTRSEYALLRARAPRYDIGV